MSNRFFPTTSPVTRIISAFILALILVSAQAASAADEPKRNPRWATPVDLPHADNFYQVTPMLFRSAQPTAEAFRQYEKFGIKTVINLRNHHSDRKYMRSGKLKLIEVRINTGSIDDDEVITVLRHIKNAQGPVLVHCQHGADRTGTIIAMYRIVFQGWSKAEALDELKNGGYGFHSIWINIPRYINKVDVKKIKTAVES